MSPGFALFVAGIGAALLVGAVAVYRARWCIASACVAVLWAITLTRLFKAGLPTDLAFVAWAALWVAVGGFVLRRGIAAGERAMAVAGGFCVVSGLSYGAAWLAGASAAFLAPPMMVADLAVVAALACLAMGAAGGSGHRVSAGQRVHALVSRVGGIRGRQVAGRPADMAAPSRRKEGSR
jgi:hypothetical protein